MESYEPLKNRKLFIGGLKSCTTNNDSLKNIFEQWGEIVDVAIIKHHKTKKSRGFGFVTYAQSFMTDEAMKNKPHIIDGREVDTKRVIEQDIDKPSIVNNVTTMYISNIKEQSEHDLLEYFGKFGNIINTKIITDRNSGQRKGFGFIKYGDAESVDKAIFIKSHQVAGGRLCVEKSISHFNDGNGSCGGCNRSCCG